MFESEIEELERVRQNRIDARAGHLEMVESLEKSIACHRHAAEVLEGETKGIDIALLALRRVNGGALPEAPKKKRQQAKRGQVERDVIAALTVPIAFEDLVTVSGHNPSSVRTALARLVRAEKAALEDGRYLAK